MQRGFVRKLKGFQRKHLRGLAHNMKPTVFIGQKGVSAAVRQSAEEALSRHELIKLKFIDFKEKNQKKEIVTELEDVTGAEMVGMIGHTAVFFRRHRDPEKRRIEVPIRER
jgi:RNA-binding protein